MRSYKELAKYLQTSESSLLQYEEELGDVSLYRHYRCLLEDALSLISDNQKKMIIQFSDGQGRTLNDILSITKRRAE